MYFDNFFTCKALLCDLEQLKTYGIGTARTDRKHFPEDLNLKPGKQFAINK